MKTEFHVGRLAAPPQSPVHTTALEDLPADPPRQRGHEAEQRDGEHQAQTMFGDAPAHRRHVLRRAHATMAPVMVWVVEPGCPAPRW